MATGRFRTPTDVLHEALRLMEERENKLAALDKAINRGLDDIRAGRVHDMNDICDELEAEIATLPPASGK